MAISLLGSKVGMTRIYNEDGTATPVTVLEMQANRISQIKTVETDGYNAVQLTVGAKKLQRLISLHQVTLQKLLLKLVLLLLSRVLILLKSMNWALS